MAKRGSPYRIPSFLFIVVRRKSIIRSDCAEDGSEHTHADDRVIRVAVGRTSCRAGGLATPAARRNEKNQQREEENLR